MHILIGLAMGFVYLWLAVAAYILAAAIIWGVFSLPCWLLLNLGCWLDRDNASQRAGEPVVIFSRTTWAWLVPGWRVGYSRCGL